MNTALRRPFVLIGLLAAMALLGISITTPSVSAGLGFDPQAATSTSDPTLSCTYTFEDNFPLNDPLVVGDHAQVTFGPEPYTAGYYPTPSDGARIRNVIDPLRTDERPGGGNYGDVWNVAQAYGFTVVGQTDGVHIGGTGTCPGDCGSPHRNLGELRLPLPQSQHAPDAARFVASYRQRVDATNRIPNPNSGGGELQVVGISSMPGHVGHHVWFSGGHSNTPAVGRVSFADGTCLWNIWDAWYPATAIGVWHDWTVGLEPSNAYADYDAYPRKSFNGFQANVSTLNEIGLTSHVRYQNHTFAVTYSDFQFDWNPTGLVQSINIPLPPGRVLYRTFNASADLSGGGNIEYYVVDANGRRTQIADGTDLSTIRGLAAPIHLEAWLSHGLLTEPSPVLTNWKVETCSRVTPTPTATGTPRPPTATATTQPTRTPRPTATPGGYFQIAPLRPAVHLKVDPVLNPPAAPNDESDWTPDQAVYYPLQVYARLVPFAYADAGQPPKLCYWGGSGWVCVNGSIQLRSYTLLGIQQGGINYLPARVGPIYYSREHRFQKWKIWDYRFDAGEYLWATWLAPNGVIPRCPVTHCVQIEDVSAGNYQIFYQVDGNIHWDRIAGVGGPYDYAFTNMYRVPISIVLPRAEP